MAKPMKILELHYPMIQFLINSDKHCHSLLAKLLFCLFFFFFTYKYRMVRNPYRSTGTIREMVSLLLQPGEKIVILSCFKALFVLQFIHYNGRPLMKMKCVELYLLRQFI